jgi:hypothetical protein
MFPITEGRLWVALLVWIGAAPAVMMRWTKRT